MSRLKRDEEGCLVFKDYPLFRPNKTPRQVILEGSFGGTYFRPIFSIVNNKKYKNIHKKYIFFNDINTDLLTLSWEEYNKSINKYNVKVGTTLEYWETQNWIHSLHPYGWFQWYCDFIAGKRSVDDERQIKRWLQTAGPNSRFRKRLINMVTDNDTYYDDYNISPKIRQTLLHWGYELSEYDF